MKLTNLFSKSNPISVFPCTEGSIIRLEHIPDQAFANCLIGDGLAIETNSLEIFAPCNGSVEMIAATKHAFALKLSNGAQLLVHIGLYQDKPYPDYYDYHVKIGDFVSEGSLIATLKKELLDLNQGKLIIPMVILNFKDHPIKSFSVSKTAKKGKSLFIVK